MTIIHRTPAQAVCCLALLVPPAIRLPFRSPSARTTAGYAARRLLLVVVPIVLICSGCRSTEKLESHPPSGPLTVDAQIEDWKGAIHRVEDERFSLGVLNDGDYLYVALVSRDRRVTGQILRSGLILWLDPEGGKEKVLGIRFPLGLTGTRSPGVPPTGTAGEAGPDPAGMQERFAATVSEVEILSGEDESGLRLPAESASGLTATAALAYGTLTYELKIPLQEREPHGYAVGTEPGATIGLGLETPELDREAIRAPMRGRGGGGRGVEMPDRGGSMRGSISGGGRPGGGSPGAQSAASVRLWTTVTLAR